MIPQKNLGYKPRFFKKAGAQERGGGGIGRGYYPPPSGSGKGGGGGYAKCKLMMANAFPSWQGYRKGDEKQEREQETGKDMNQTNGECFPRFAR